MKRRRDCSELDVEAQSPQRRRGWRGSEGAGAASRAVAGMETRLPQSGDAREAKTTSGGRADRGAGDATAVPECKDGVADLVEVNREEERVAK